MRYFGGTKGAEIGEVLGITGRTVRRDWEKARLLLPAKLRSRAAATVASPSPLPR